MKRTNPQPYYSYLVRLWPGNGKQWHATVQDVHSGDRQTFGDLTALFAFLTQHTEPAAEDDPAPGPNLPAPGAR